MIVKDEIFFEIEKRSQRTLYLVLVLFVTVSALFLGFIGRFDNNPFKLHRVVSNILELKLSSNDLVSLLNVDESMSGRWVNVQLIDRDRRSAPVKIRHTSIYSLNFRININDSFFNLYRAVDQGKEIYDFFRTAANWGIDTSDPQLVQLKINNVLIGIYFMEKQIYEQIRDENGSYFVHLDADVLLLNRILYQEKAQAAALMGKDVPAEEPEDTRMTPSLAVENNNKKKKLLNKHFDVDKLASYLVFFSLFSYDEVLDFQRLVFRFDPYVKKFMPYLTMESVIFSLQEQNKSFKSFPSDSYAYKLNQKNFDSLYARAFAYKYGYLVRSVLSRARASIAGGLKN